MADELMTRKQQNRTQQLKFITKQLTPSNPKDLFYVNIEELFKTYFGLILIGMIMVAYMIFY